MGKEVIIKTIFEEVFQFLKDDFNIIPIISRKERWGYYYSGKNYATGIEIIYESPEGYVNIMLYKLINGNIEKNTVSAIRDNKTINGSSLDYIVQLKDEGASILPAYKYSNELGISQGTEGIKIFFSKFASNLKQYADDVLNGDFSIFIQLEKTLKNKYTDYYKENSEQI